MGYPGQRYELSYTRQPDEPPPDPGPVTEYRRVKEYDNLWSGEMVGGSPVALAPYAGSTLTDRFGLAWGVGGIVSSLDIAQIDANGVHLEEAGTDGGVVFSASIADMIAKGGDRVFHKTDRIFIVLDFAELSFGSSAGNNEFRVYYYLYNASQSQHINMRRGWFTGGTGDIVRCGIGDGLGSNNMPTKAESNTDLTFGIEAAWLSTRIRYQQIGDPLPEEPADMLSKFHGGAGSDMCTIKVEDTTGGDVDVAGHPALVLEWGINAANSPEAIVKWLRTRAYRWRSGLGLYD